MQEENTVAFSVLYNPRDTIRMFVRFFSFSRKKKKKKKTAKDLKHQKSIGSCQWKTRHSVDTTFQGMWIYGVITFHSIWALYSSASCKQLKRWKWFKITQLSLLSPEHFQLFKSNTASSAITSLSTFLQPLIYYRAYGLPTMDSLHNGTMEYITFCALLLL